MKILIGNFTAESNEHVACQCDLEGFIIKKGEKIIDDMKIKDIFEAANIELIPSIGAEAWAPGVVTKEAFDLIENELLSCIQAHIEELDGIFLFLHGASHVVDLEGGSGDHHILNEIRKIVGPYLPIAIVMDPHGNLSKEFVEQTTLLRCFRESPHTDTLETYRLVAKMFVELLNHRQNIHPVYRKLPLVLGGEQSVSTDEPMISINKYLDMIESDEKIRSCSFHIGCIRHDTYLVGCSVVVVPTTENDALYANNKANEIAQYIFDQRKLFHYSEIAVDVDKAINMALEFKGKPVFITDSGDNVTAGSTGCSTFLLRKFLLRNEFCKKKILFASIVDSKTIDILNDYQIGEEVNVEIGTNDDEFSKSVNLNVKIILKGHLENYYGDSSNMGKCLTVSLEDKPIDIAVSENSISHAEIHQFTASKLDINDYDIIIVKQGYIFPELKAVSQLSIMALTPGATNQDIKKLNFKRIMRPMFPIDNI